MRNYTRDKTKQLPIVYVQKIYIVSCGFLPYYKSIDVDIISFVFNQLELANSVNLRVLALPYDSL